MVRRMIGQRSLVEELAKFPVDLNMVELIAIANLALIMGDIQVSILKGKRRLILHIKDGRIVGREWRRER